MPPDAVLGLREPVEDDPLWWLSFCGASFLGAVITQAPTLAAAITRSHVLGVNPGGEIQALGPLPVTEIAAQWRDRLLSAAEIEAIPEPEGL